MSKYSSKPTSHFCEPLAKSKQSPYQHSVQVLREIGHFPGFIICRCEFSLSEEIKEKISLFCNVPRRAVMKKSTSNIVFMKSQLNFMKEGIDSLICERLNLPNTSIDLSDWKKLFIRFSIQRDNHCWTCRKVCSTSDAYKSVIESLFHGALAAVINFK